MTDEERLEESLAQQGRREEDPFRQTPVHVQEAVRKAVRQRLEQEYREKPHLAQIRGPIERAIEERAATLLRDIMQVQLLYQRYTQARTNPREALGFLTNYYEDCIVVATELRQRSSFYEAAMKRVNRYFLAEELGLFDSTKFGEEFGVDTVSITQTLARSRGNLAAPYAGQPISDLADVRGLLKADILKKMYLDDIRMKGADLKGAMQISSSLMDYFNAPVNSPGELSLG